MSDEERDDRDEHEEPREGESNHEWMQRQTSPELRWLDLFQRLTARVETNEDEARRRAEETQRNIDFIVGQQAQFSTDLQRLREMQERSEQRWEDAENRWERIERMWERTEGSVRSLHAIAQIHEGEINTLAEAQLRTGAQMAETNERLNALINTVERVISERRNGGKQKSEGSE